MFTLDDIRNIALHLESNGEATYRRAARLCPDPDITRLLTAMADDEARHYQWLATISSTRELSEEERAMAQMGRELLAEMMSSNPFLPDGDQLAAGVSLEEVLQRCRDFEEDTVVFYRFLLALLEDGEAIAEMERIIAEEGRHQQALVTMLAEQGEKPLAHLPC